MRWDPTGYEGRDPGPADMFLVIEVGWSRRRFDRRVKVPLYARTGIPKYGSSTEKMLFVFCDLAEGEYRTAKTLRRGGSVACTAFPNDPMPVDQIIL